jgi:hypothetical protein
MISKALRDAYIFGYGAVRCGDLKLDMFPSNPYDVITENELFSYWEIGFDDAYQEAFDMHKLLEEINNDPEEA